MFLAWGREYRPWDNWNHCKMKGGAFSRERSRQWDSKILSINFPKSPAKPQHMNKWQIQSSFHFSSIQSLGPVWLFDPMDCSMPGFPVHHQLPEFSAKDKIINWALIWCPQWAKSSLRFEFNQFNVSTKWKLQHVLELFNRIHTLHNIWHSKYLRDNLKLLVFLNLLE